MKSDGRHCFTIFASFTSYFSLEKHYHIDIIILFEWNHPFVLQSNPRRPFKTNLKSKHKHNRNLNTFTMLILYESSVGYSLFRVMDAAKFKKMSVDNIYHEFSDQSKRSQFVQLHAFQPFKDMEEAEDAVKCLCDGLLTPLLYIECNLSLSALCTRCLFSSESALQNEWRFHDFAELTFPGKMELKSTSKITLKSVSESMTNLKYDLEYDLDSDFLSLNFHNHFNGDFHSVSGCCFRE